MFDTPFSLQQCSSSPIKYLLWSVDRVVFPVPKVHKEKKQNGKNMCVSGKPEEDCRKPKEDVTPKDHRRQVYKEGTQWLP